MSAKPLMLEGLAPVEDPKGKDGMLHEWRKEKQRLEEEVRGLRHDLDEAEVKNAALERSLRNLRRQLSPLHNALRAVFGEIELGIADREEATTSTPSQSGSSLSSNDPRWESYKQTFPGTAARIIDALLAHREMSISQLAALLKAHYNTVNSALLVLSKAGAVSKENGKYRLKT